MHDSEHLDVIERAMVGIRRSQRRRSLAQRAGAATRSFGDSVYDVIDAIEGAEEIGASIGVSSIAAALSIDQPRASRLVAAAVTAGLIYRKADQADGRRTFLVRTDTGRALSNTIRRFRKSVFEAAMSDWSDVDRADFARLLSRFVASLSRTTEVARRAVGA